MCRSLLQCVAGFGRCNLFYKRALQHLSRGSFTKEQWRGKTQRTIVYVVCCSALQCVLVCQRAVDRQRWEESAICACWIPLQHTATRNAPRCTTLAKERQGIYHTVYSVLQFVECVAACCGSDTLFRSVFARSNGKAHVNPHESNLETSLSSWI